MIRDEALAVSGLLSHKMHGPSVMPYQPDGIWKSTYSSDRWATSPGDDKHRRGLYTFLKPHLALPGDARLRRPEPRILHNPPLEHEHPAPGARHLERHGLYRGGPGPSAAGRPRRRPGRLLIGSAWRCDSPWPDRPGRVRSKPLPPSTSRRRTFYRDHPGDARTFATDPSAPCPTVGTPPTWPRLTAVCNVILNLDEFLTRG